MRCSKLVQLISLSLASSLILSLVSFNVLTGQETQLKVPNQRDRNEQLQRSRNGQQQQNAFNLDFLEQMFDSRGQQQQQPKQQKQQEQKQQQGGLNLDTLGQMFSLGNQQQHLKQMKQFRQPKQKQQQQGDFNLDFWGQMFASEKQQQPKQKQKEQQQPGNFNLDFFEPMFASGKQQNPKQSKQLRQPKQKQQQQHGNFDLDILKLMPSALNLLRQLLPADYEQQGGFNFDDLQQMFAPIGKGGSLDMDKVLKGEFGERMSETVELRTGEKISLFDHILLDKVPEIWQQAPSNENGTASQFKELAYSDDSNDDAVHLNSQEIILRSGYKYELYDAVADDGYITQVIRLINPLADRTRLRYPPILMEHGGTIDPSAYLLASSIQHIPEKYPRTPQDGPIKSSNRSLAFLLANHGFDVFLCETRGSNDNNNKHIGDRALRSALSGSGDKKNRTFMETADEVTRQWDFWSFTQDDIIAHELKSHMDTVMNVTGAKQVSVFTFSLSTPTSFAFFSIRPDYARKVHGFVSMAPIVSGQGLNMFLTIAMERLCPLVPDIAGTMLFTDLAFSQLSRDMAVQTMKNKRLRYSIYKMLSNLSLGASAQYQTNLELNLIGHLLRRLSFKEAKQLCQQMASNKLQKYDHGPFKNLQLYGSETPPVYDLSDLKIKDWLLVSAWNDALSTPQVVDHLLKIVNPKPIAHIVAPYNHVDLIAAFDNDKYVNMPILNYFKKMSFDPNEREPMASTVRSMSIDLKPLFAPLQVLNSENNVFGSNHSDYQQSRSLARSFRPRSDEDLFNKMSSSVPLNMMARSFQRGMRMMLDGLGKTVSDPRIELPIQITEVKTGTDKPTEPL